MDFALWTWFVEHAAGLSRARGVPRARRSGSAIGPRKVAGFTLGSVTATLLAGVLIGQLGSRSAGRSSPTFFLLFLFAVGYGVGPQFFRGLGKEGPRADRLLAGRARAVPGRPGRLCAIAAGLDVGYAAGLYAGSQTISAGDRRRDRSDRAARLTAGAGEGLRRRRADRLRRHLYLRHDRLGDRAGAARPEADRRRSARRPAPSTSGRWAAGSCGSRCRRPSPPIAQSSCAPTASTRRRGLTGRPVRELFPGLRVFVERVRRGDRLIDADGDTVLAAGDVVAISGPRQVLVERVEAVRPRGPRRRAAEPAGDGGRRLRHEQGVQRQDAARAGGSAVRARRLPAARSPGTWWRCRSCPRRRCCAATS